MHQDLHSLLRRTQIFIRELEDNNYPNAIKLAELTNCSVPTAKRHIARLQNENRLPVLYDTSRKGYYLASKDYFNPSSIPPGKDEFCALLLARDLLKSLGIGELDERIDALWSQFSSQNRSVRADLEQMVQYFSSDSTVIGDLADKEILNYVQAAASGDSVRLVYRSPWRHAEDKVYEGRIAQVHFSDGHLYLGFVERNSDGASTTPDKTPPTRRAKVLNASFVKEFRIIPESVGIDGAIDLKNHFKNWRDGFGIWAHAELTTVQIRINPPASRFYAAERWHEDQEDSWDGEVLTRQFPAIVSPEVARRVLSLGEHVVGVEPKELRDEVVRQAKCLVEGVG